MKRFKISYSSRSESIKKHPTVSGTYFVTGATGTIGGEICKYLASDANSFVFAGTKDLDRFEESGLGKHANIKPVVLGESELVRDGLLFSPLMEINGVVHCEGLYGELGEIKDVNLDNWIDNLSTYLRRTISLIRWMESSSQSAHISSVFIGGGGASEAYIGLSNYAVMKTALVRVIETAALEISTDKLSLNVLGPGPTKSKMVQDVLSSTNRIDNRILDGSTNLNATNGGVSLRVYEALNFLFSSAGRENSGRFFSAEWDDFSDLNTQDSNSYKLRRVIPDF